MSNLPPPPPFSPFVCDRCCSIPQILRQPEEEGEEPEESFYGSSNNRMLRATPEKPVRREGGYLSDAHRRLAQEVSEGIEAAYDRDPDIRAKSEDVRLLNVSVASRKHCPEAAKGRVFLAYGAGVERTTAACLVLHSPCVGIARCIVCAPILNDHSSTTARLQKRLATATAIACRLACQSIRAR